VNYNPKIIVFDLNIPLWDKTVLSKTERVLVFKMIYLMVKKGYDQMLIIDELIWS